MIRSVQLCSTPDLAVTLLRASGHACRFPLCVPTRIGEAKVASEKVDEMADDDETEEQRR